MKSKALQEIGISALLIILLILLLNPFNMFMPNMMLVMILVAAVVVFGIFAALIFKEKGGDEREMQHRMLAGRAAFFAGSVTLVIGIIVQSFSHTVDVWLIVALVAMIVAKIVTRRYSDKNK